MALSKSESSYLIVRARSSLHYARKKKKAKSKADDEKNRERDHVKELLLKEDDTVKTGSPSGSSRNSPAVGGSNDKKTDAERRFEEVQKRRVSSLHN